MSYIVPSELPKTCHVCPFGHVIMQNPLSSKTPIKKYRCQVGKAPWKTFDVDFFDNEYKDKGCPLVPMERIVQRLEELQEEYMYPDDDDYIVGQYDGVREALTVVLEEGGLND